MRLNNFIFGTIILVSEALICLYKIRDCFDNVLGT